MKVCCLNILKRSTCMTSALCPWDNVYFFLFRYNRFGYPVFPQKAFGLPSPSGPVSFAGFSSPVSQVLLRWIFWIFFYMTLHWMCSWVFCHLPLLVTAINPHQLTSSSSSGLGARLGPPSLQQNRCSFLLSTNLDVVNNLLFRIFAFLLMCLFQWNAF